jgi:hypothetical protein
MYLWQEGSDVDKVVKQQSEDINSETSNYNTKIQRAQAIQRELIQIEELQMFARKDLEAQQTQYENSLQQLEDLLEDTMSKKHNL